MVKYRISYMDNVDLDGEEAYGTWANLILVKQIKKLNSNGQKELIKELWASNPKKYFEWKDWCIECNRLPDLFGTRDNPLPVDESKL